MAAANVGNCSDKRRDLVALDQIRRDQGRRSRRSETPDGVLRCRVEMLPQRAFYASCRVFAGDPLAPALCSRAQIACPGCQRLRGIALAFSGAGVRAFGMDVRVRRSRGDAGLDFFSKSSGLPQPSTSRPTDSISAHNELRNWSSSSMTYTREIITQPKRNYRHSTQTQLPVRSL